MRHFASTRRATALLLLAGQVVATSGCTGWITQKEGVAATIAAHPELRHSDTVTSVALNGNADTTVKGKRMRVTSTSVGTLELQNLHTANDTLFGRVSDRAPEVGIPIATITAVELHGVSSGKTLALVAGLGAAVATLYLVSLLVVESALCDGFGC